MSFIRRLFAVLAAAAGYVYLESQALAEVVVPDAPEQITLPVDVDGWISAAIASLGILVGVILGGFFAFKLIKVVLRWIGLIGS